MYHAGLITQLWTAALMRNSYEWIALSSGDCRNDRVSTPLISVLTAGHSSMSVPRPRSFVHPSWFGWTAHPGRLGKLHGSGDVDCRMLIREHTSSTSMTAPSDAGTWRRIEWVYTLFVGGPAASVGRRRQYSRSRLWSIKWCHIQWVLSPLTQISRPRLYSTYNDISETIQDSAIVLWNGNRNSYVIYRMVPFQWS